MTQAPRPRRRLHSFGALLAGLVVIVILSIATDAVVFRGVASPGQATANSLWVLATAYRFLYGVLGCWLAARLAPARPMGHALVLGLVGLTAGVVGALAARGGGPELGPGWYPLAVLVIQLPCAWLGGRLERSRVSRLTRSAVT